MINQYATNIKIENVDWIEVPYSYHFQNEPTFYRMVNWCEEHKSQGLFRWHFTLKFPIYQGSFWFEKPEDSLEFRIVWL